MDINLDGHITRGTSTTVISASFVILRFSFILNTFLVL
jgi:hypothetical protein